MLSLIKYDMWGLILCAESTRSALSPPLISPTNKEGPTKTEDPSSLLVQITPLLTRSLNKIKLEMEEYSIGYEILQIIRRWKALDEENTLEQLIFSLVSCESLTL
jgi:hypothetical protein